MKNGVGLATGNFAIAMSSRNGREAASAGRFRRTLSDSEETACGEERG